MATKKTRMERMQRLQYLAKRLQECTTIAAFNPRTVKRRLKEFKEFMPVAVDAHLKYLSHEEDEATKTEAEQSWREAMDEAEEIFDDAGEKYDALVAEPEVIAITEEQEENVALARITTA